MTSPDLSRAQRPQVAVSAAIFRGTGDIRELLLVRRASNPLSGLYSLPGGRVEFGETLHEALAREVREETSLAIDIIGLAGWIDVVMKEAGHHFVILPFAASWRSGDVVLNDELDDYKWIKPHEIGNFATTQGLVPIVEAAVALARR